MYVSMLLKGFRAVMLTNTGINAAANRLEFDEHGRYVGAVRIQGVCSDVR